jgi:phenylacetate-CoA ligase
VVKTESALPPDLARGVRRAWRSPAGRQLLTEAGLTPAKVTSLADFARIRVVRREDVVELQRAYPDRAGFSSVPLNKMPWLGLHPGGELDPSYAGRRAPALLADLFADMGMRAGDVVVDTFNYHLSSVAHAFDAAAHRLGACVVPAGPGNSQLQLDMIERVGATVWLGFPSFLGKMLGEAPPEVAAALKLRLAICGGEYAPKIRTELRDRFGVHSRDFYGVSLVGPVAYECERGDGYHLRPEVHVELLVPGTAEPAPPGEVGEIVLTPTRNEYALLRLGTGDLSQWLDEEQCGCGRLGPRLKGILGRIGASVKVRGTFIHPRDVGQLALDVPHVVRCHVRVTRPSGSARDLIAVLVEAEPGLSAQARGDDMLERVAAAFAARCRLRSDEVSFAGQPHEGPVIVDERDWEVS